MSLRIYANNAKTLLAGPVGPADTSITVSDGSIFPTPGSNEYFTITIDSGTSLEIVDVYGKSGNVLTGLQRGREGTAPQSFLTGTRVENRVTAETLQDFARLVDRLADISSVDLLPRPVTTLANSYLCASADDGGTPIVAIKHNLIWRFANHPLVVYSGAATQTDTTTSLTLAGANAKAPISNIGSHIIQFTSGLNMGYPRLISSSNSTGLVWSTPLPNIVQSGDAFEIYESSAYTLGYLSEQSEDPLIFSILFGG